MLTLAQLQANRPLLNKIDWQMTPEKAVEMYLEWGTGWVRGHDFVAGRNDESYYFVLFRLGKTVCHPDQKNGGGRRRACQDCCAG